MTLNLERAYCRNARSMASWSRAFCNRSPVGDYQADNELNGLELVGRIQLNPGNGNPDDLVRQNPSGFRAPLTEVWDRNERVGRRNDDGNVSLFPKLSTTTSLMKYGTPKFRRADPTAANGVPHP